MQSTLVKLYWLLFLVLHSRAISAATLLRTAVIPRLHQHELGWLDDSGQRRQLLGYHECRDGRWGPLRDRMQLLLQLQDGYTRQDADRLASQLHADGAVISTSLPDHTWLLLARPDSLKPDAYRPHVLVPYSPDYKVAPEWHPVLEAIQQQQAQARAAAGASHHLQTHKRIMSHASLQHLRVADAAQHLRLAAAAVAGDGAVRAELKDRAPAKVLIGVHFAEVPPADLLRLGVKPEQFHPAAAAASDWAQPLQGVVVSAERSKEHQQLCQPELVASSPWELDVAVCPQDLSEVLYWLSNQAVVHWLAPRPRLYFQNMAASKIIQSSTMKTALDYSTPDATAFWAAGLDGRGQIVGIGDSGIDMNSCFFSDPLVPFTAPVSSKEWANPQHRKVVYYYGLADEYFRDLVGHGTHTSGSVAGFNPNAPDSKASGAAKGARLAFVDLSRTAGGDVNAPQDLARDYFPKMYERGACIFSDSWGSTSPVYDFQASKLDSWLYNNQDCISHFAAGNYGENDNLDSTITSPATAKNAVTVGATKSAVANYVSQTIAPVFSLSVEIKRKDKPVQYVGVRLVKADFGGDGASLSGKGLRVMRASPEQACTSLDGAASGAYANSILMVKRGSCYFSEKLRAGAEAGVAALVIINDKPGGYFKMDSQEVNAGATIPVFGLTRRAGRQLWASFENADAIAATIERYAQGWPAYEDIASFSSFGPTADGRIKPDIVAPGELVSASSADTDPSTSNTATCNIGRKAGTSMATPMVAGHTAIVRQYFMEGFYPSGAPGNAPYVPSGPLMKGVMLGGACDMQGNTEQYLPLEDSPSMRQGFGRFCLCNAVKLASNCTTNMQFVDRVPIASQETHKYCLATTGGDVRITLTWYDPPASPSADKALVNDLDLSVVSAGMNGQAFFGNMELEKDSVNTVERVWLRNVPPGGLDISVTAGQLSQLTRSQNYSLVVQGAFSGTLSSPYNPDPTAARTPAGCTPQAMQQVAAAAVPAQPAPAVAAPAVVEEKGPAAAPSAAVNVTVASSAVASAAIAPAAPAAGPAQQPQPTATPAAPDAAAAQAAAAQAAAAQAAAAQAAAAQAAAAQAAAAQPAVAAPVVTPAAQPAPPVTPQVTSTDTASLVASLVGAMQTQPAMTQSVPGSGTPGAPDTAARGRRLTAVPAWIRDTNMSVAITKVPLMVCRWINATAKKAVTAVSGEQQLPAATAGAASSAARSLQAQAGAAAAGPLLLPLQHLVLAGAMVLMGVVLLSVGVRRYQIYRSISLTSAVRKDMSVNKAMGRAPTGEAALLQALLSDPSLAEQLSPGKRNSLMAQAGSAAAASPFESGVSFSAGSTSSSSLHGSQSSGVSLSLSPASSNQDSPEATPSPYEPLIVQLARHSAKGASMPAPCRPMSVPPGSTMPPAHSAPIPTMRSAPVSPVGTPVLAGSRRGLLGAPVPAARDGELRVVVNERGVSRVSDSMLPLPRAGLSPDQQYTPGRLPRCSNSFTFGHLSAEAASEAEVCDEVFGLAQAPSAPAAAGLCPEQLRSKSMQGMRLPQLQQEALLSHWRPLSPDSPECAAAAAPVSPLSGDAGQKRDQQ